MVSRVTEPTEGMSYILSSVRRNMVNRSSAFRFIKMTLENSSYSQTENREDGAQDLEFNHGLKLLALAYYWSYLSYRKDRIYGGNLLIRISYLKALL